MSDTPGTDANQDPKLENPENTFRQLTAAEVNLLVRALVAYMPRCDDLAEKKVAVRLFDDLALQNSVLTGRRNVL